MRTIVVGDVHGCIEELTALLGAVGFAAGDHLIFVGDLVAKGPDSQAVVQLARERGARAVRGNHDHKVLALRDPEARSRARPRSSTHTSVADALGPADWEWLEAQPLWLRLDEHDVLVVHGGIVPDVAPERHAPADLMNLRSIRPDGTPSRRTDGGVPWASLFRGPGHVVFGHDAVRGLQRHPHATGLDTGCVYGGSLTALVLPEGRIRSVPARRVWSPPTDPTSDG